MSFSTEDTIPSSTDTLKKKEGNVVKTPLRGVRPQRVDEEVLPKESSGLALKQPNENAKNTLASADTGEEEKPAPRGQCKFDGTDYPDWLPINPFRGAEEPFVFPFPEVDGDPWVKAAELVNDYDNGMCTAWTEEIQNILIFAGLFSAVVTAFAISTQSMLEPDPAIASVLLLAHLSAQALANNGTGLSSVNTIAAKFQKQNGTIQSLRINVFMHFSLVLSLGTALVGIIALQWVRSYRQHDSRLPKDRTSLRQFRYDNLMKWKVPAIISSLPLILQASLIIFFAGLIDLLHSLNTTLSIIILLLVGVIVLFVLFTMLAPCIALLLNPWTSGYVERHPKTRFHSPYQSPQSWLFVRLLLFLRKAYDYARDPKWSYAYAESQLVNATSWLQLAQADFNLQLYHSGLSPITDAIGWISDAFPDVESFCTLFHCFQTLNDQEMRDTLVKIRGEGDSV